MYTEDCKDGVKSLLASEGAQGTLKQRSSEMSTGATGKRSGCQRLAWHSEVPRDHSPFLSFVAAGPPPPLSNPKKNHPLLRLLFFYVQELRRSSGAAQAQLRRSSGATDAGSGRCYDLSIGLCVARPKGDLWRPPAQLRRGGSSSRIPKRRPLQNDL